MIPKINNRGHSFKGVAAYLIHDKDKAETSERVAWTHTENLPTDDIEKAAKVMAFTDISRDKIRADYGGSAAGRKGEKGNIYHRSLSWALSENPSDEHMLETARAFIKNEGLCEHQSFMIAHNDTEYKHLHLVTNLVHPETGKIHDMGLDKRRSQKWALEYEREHGIHCQTRVDNAAKRAQGEPTKHQDQKQDYSDKITRAYYAADNGASFIQALKEEGLQLGKARRGDRNFVVVDDKGDIQKLSRQLQIEERGKLKTKAIQALLSDIDRDHIQDGESLAREIKTREQESLSELAQRKREASDAEHSTSQAHNQKQAKAKEQSKQDYFDRDAYQTQQDNAIEAAALKATLEAEKQDQKARIFKDQDSRKEKQEDLRRDTERVRDFGSFADELDKTREKEAQADRQAARAQKIFGQQEKNIAEGIRLGRIKPPEKAKETKTAKEALAEFERTAPPPEPKQARAKKQNAKEMLDQFERSAPKPQEPRPAEQKRSFSEAAKDFEKPPPVPEPAPNPLPQQRFADVAQQFEKSSSNDNAPAPAQETSKQQSGPSRDGGGFER